MKIIYEGDSKVKQENMIYFKANFETLRMLEDEDIAIFIHRVDEIINSINSLGGKPEENEIVKNILRSLLKSYSAKVFVIEKAQNLDQYTRDQLFGDLTTFKLRDFDKDASRKETSFKVIKKEMMNLI